MIQDMAVEQKKCIVNVNLIDQHYISLILKMTNYLQF